MSQINNWEVFEKILNDRLQLDRNKLENDELNVTETAVIRGRIGVLKELLRTPQVLDAQAWKEEPDA